MELDSLECVSSSDGMDEDEAAVAARLPHASFTKPHVGGGNAGGNGGNASGAAPPGISPVTSVHELLECPVCTNSMYPPIHQAGGHCNGNTSAINSSISFMRRERSSKETWREIGNLGGIFLLDSLVQATHLSQILSFPLWVMAHWRQQALGDMTHSLLVVFLFMQGLGIVGECDSVVVD